MAAPVTSIGGSWSAATAGTGRCCGRAVAGAAPTVSVLPAAAVKTPGCVCAG